MFECTVICIYRVVLKKWHILFPYGDALLGTMQINWCQMNRYSSVSCHRDNFIVSAMLFIQTEAERQRRETGFIQRIEKGIRSYLYAYMFVCFSRIFSRLRALTEPRVIRYGMVVDNTLLRHVFSAVVFPARAWRVIPIGLVPIGFVCSHGLCIIISSQYYGQGNCRHSCTWS